MTLTDILPLTKFAAVTPDDAADLDPIPRAVLVSTAGVVNILDAAGNVVSLTLAAGVFHPIRPRRILATDTPTYPADGSSSSSPSSSSPSSATTAAGIVTAW